MLAVVRIRGRPGEILEKLSQKVHDLLRKEDLSIKVEHYITRTDFLDVKLSLEKNKYRPYRKPNDFPMYIDAQSNHPPA